MMQKGHVPWKTFPNLVLETVRNILILTALVTFLILNPVISLGSLSNQTVIAADTRIGETLSEENTQDKDRNAKGINEPSAGQKPTGSLISEDKGTSNKQEAPLDEEDEDNRNGPDDPE